MAIYSNLIVDQGSNFTSTITVTDSDGDIVNLTGYTYAGKIKKNYSSATAVSFVTPTTPGSNGQIEIRLTDTQTKLLESGRYVYDVEIYSSGGVTTRVVEGQLEVTAGVTLGGV